MKPLTQLVRSGLLDGEPTGAISTPIYQSATFRHVGGVSTGHDYTRSSNPTRAVLERAMAELEGGARGIAFSSGMAAISAVLSLLNPGDRLVVSDDLYGGTYRLLEQLYRKYGIDARYVDTSDLAATATALSEPGVVALFVETPTNPMMKITDLAAVSALARKNGQRMIVDNTFMTPYLQHPIALGADIVVHSGTKFLGGHNDTLCGIAVAADREIGEQIAWVQNAVGSVLSPFDSWLILRGIKTLGVRLDRAQRNAAAVARFLSSHPAVGRVFYPGLESHPGHAVHRKQAEGDGAMVSAELRDPAMVDRVLRKVGVWSYAESLGGVESLITLPARQTHADIPEEVRNRMGVTAGLLRFSVGIEDGDDLLKDLDNALSGKGG